MVRKPATSCSLDTIKEKLGGAASRRFFFGLRRLAVGLIVLASGLLPKPSEAVVLWSDLGATQVRDTGPGVDILGGVLRRDDSAKDALYFKFHVEPLSDATKEEYFATFQLFETNSERLAVGNALRAWAYSVIPHAQAADSNRTD